MKGYIYLAAPIDFAHEEDRARIEAAKLQFKGLFRARGWGTFDPAAAFTVGRGQPPTPRVMAVNNMALGRSDAVVAMLPAGVSTLGTPIEIDRAATNGIPVLIVGAKQSWALARYQNYPNVRHLDDTEDLTEPMEWLCFHAEHTGPQERIEALPVAAVREGEPFVLPVRNYEGDAGFDLYVSQDIEVPWGQTVDVPCNTAVELPDHVFGIVVGRSSTLRHKSLQVHPGIIDSGYRGELFAAVSVVGGQGSVQVKRGERLAQFLLLPNVARGFKPTSVDRLASSDRDAAGFGSTGR